MKRHLIAVGIALIALAAWVGTASAAAGDPPPGADQALGQLAGTLQGAPASGTAGQTASDVSLPTGYAYGGTILAPSPGSSAANQTATNTGTADASNTSTTAQTATPTQTGGSSSCTAGCGGAGQSQRQHHREGKN